MPVGAIQGRCPMGEDLSSGRKKQCLQINQAIDGLNQVYARYADQPSVQTLIKHSVRLQPYHLWQHDVGPMLAWEAQQLHGWLLDIGVAIDQLERVLGHRWSQIQHHWFCDHEQLQIQQLRYELETWRQRSYQALALQWLHILDDLEQGQLEPSLALDVKIQYLFTKAYRSCDAQIVAVLLQAHDAFDWVQDGSGQVALMPKALSFLTIHQVSLGWWRWLLWLFPGLRFRHRLTHRPSKWVHLFACKQRLDRMLADGEVSMHAWLVAWQAWEHAYQQECAWVQSEQKHFWFWGSGFSRKVAQSWLDHLASHHVALTKAISTQCLKSIAGQHWQARLDRIKYAPLIIDFLMHDQDRATYFTWLANDLAYAWQSMEHDASVLLEAHVVHACQHQAWQTHHYGRSICTLSRYAVAEDVSQEACQEAIKNLKKGVFSEVVSDALQDVLDQRRAWYQGLVASSDNAIMPCSQDTSIVLFEAQQPHASAQTLLQSANRAWHGWLQRGDARLLVGLKRFYQRPLLHAHWAATWGRLTLQWCQASLLQDPSHWQQQWLVVRDRFGDVAQIACSYEWFANWLESLADGEWSLLRQHIVDAWGSSSLQNQVRCLGLKQWLKGKLSHDLTMIWPVAMTLEQCIGSLAIPGLMDVLHETVYDSGCLCDRHRMVLARCAHDPSVLAQPAWPALSALSAWWQLHQDDWIAPERVCTTWLHGRDDHAVLDQALNRWSDLLAQDSSSEIVAFKQAIHHQWLKRLKRCVLDHLRQAVSENSASVSQWALLIGQLLETKQRQWFAAWEPLYDTLLEGESLLCLLKDWSEQVRAKLAQKPWAHQQSWLSHAIHPLLTLGLVPQSIQVALQKALAIAHTLTWSQNDRQYLQALQAALSGTMTSANQHCLLQACGPKREKAQHQTGWHGMDRSYERFVMHAEALSFDSSYEGMDQTPSPLRSHVLRCMRTHTDLSSGTCGLLNASHRISPTKGV